MACLWTNCYPCNVKTLYWVHVLNHMLLLLPRLKKLPITNTQCTLFVLDSKSTIYIYYILLIIYSFVSLLELLVEFIVSHLSKHFHVDLYR